MGIGRSARSNSELPEVDVGFTPNEDAAGSRGSVSSPRLLVVLGFFGLGALWFLSGLDTSSSSRSERSPSAGPDRPQLIVPTPVPTPTPAPEPTPIGALFAETQASRVARTQLAIAGSAHTVAYAAVGGFGIVDISTGDVALVDPGFTSLSADVRVGRQARVHGFEAGDLGLLARVATASLVATTGEDGVLAFTAGLDAFVFTLNTETTGLGDRHAVPDGAVLSAFDGHGIAAFVKGEGTVVFGADGPVLVTDAEIVAANEDARIERRCADVCTLDFVDLARGESHPLPADLVGEGSRYMVSPDAEFILHVAQDGSGTLYDVGDRSLSWVADSGIDNAAWAPDTSFVAWVDVNGGELKLMLTERQAWIVVKLNVLGAPPAQSGELEVLLTPS